MKRIFIFAAAVSLGFSIAGCSSTKATGDARDTSAYQQNQAMNLPAWVDTTFKSGWNKGGYYWKGPIDEAGFYASGQGKYGDVQTSTTSADLDGKAQIAFFIKQEINAIAEQEASKAGAEAEKQEELKSFQSAVASVKIAGIMRADRFIGEDGTVYVLMFVPDSEIKKAVPANSEFAKAVVEKYLASLSEEKSE